MRPIQILMDYEIRSSLISSIKRAALWLIKMIVFAACAFGILALIVCMQMLLTLLSEKMCAVKV
jgi:heme/copper-type cytochrome/quinol oxidase subunit 1